MKINFPGWVFSALRRNGRRWFFHDRRETGCRLVADSIRWLGMGFDFLMFPPISRIYYSNPIVKPCPLPHGWSPCCRDLVLQRSQSTILRLCLSLCTSPLYRDAQSLRSLQVWWHHHNRFAEKFPYTHSRAISSWSLSSCSLCFCVNVSL